MAERVAYEDPRAPLCSSLVRRAPVDGGLSGDPEFADAQQWRADNSLRSDAAWVEEVHRGHPEPSTWAHPATPEEDADLKSRPGHNGEASAKVNGYTARFPETFAGVWIDQSARGRITVAFTADQDTRHRELHRLLGDGVNLAVVAAQTTLAELRRLSDDVRLWVEEQDLAGGWGVREDIGMVEIGLFVRDEGSVRAVVDRFAGRPFCIEGRAPDEIISEGPQPQSGEGWRLLADQPKGRSWAVGVAQDKRAYEQLWGGLRLAGQPPPVNFDQEIVLHFGPAVSGSCRNVRLDGIVVDEANQVVYPRVMLPGTKQQICTSDANPYTYLVAMQRQALPDDFTLQVSKELSPCAGCLPDAQTRVHQRR